MMPKVATYTLRWSSIHQTYELLEQGKISLQIEVGGPDWFAWSAEISSFAFQGKLGSYSAHKESKQRGGLYWHAYQRMQGKLVKKYLGKSTNLTLARLEQIAGALQAAHFDSAALPAEQGAEKKTRTRVVSSSPEPLVTEDSAVRKRTSNQSSDTPTPRRTALLSTKLHVPPPPLQYVQRTRLEPLFQETLTRPITLIAAAAGFGKTTALIGWLEHTQVATAWVALDSGDDEPARFWCYVLAALERLSPGIATDELASLQAPQPPLLESILTSVINNLETMNSEIVLVLDDYHTISAPAIHSSMTFLLEHLPPHLHLVIATRADPPLPLARLRMRGQLNELRTKDLRFTIVEATAFFAQTGRLQLAASEILTLETRTEGWIAGLQLAALSLQGRSDSADFIQAFTGSYRHVVDYLIQEVLERQPPHIQTFLLHTAILDRLNGSLCDAVAGQEDSQVMLEWLEQANLFLMPLDDERQYYRYHQLFADVLRQRLQKLQPNHIAHLHRLAAHWYEHQDFVAEAIQHFLAAGDSELAAQLIAQRAETMIMQGDLAELLHWLNIFPGEVVRSHMQLCLIHGEVMAFVGLLDAAEARLQEVEQLIADRTALAGESTLEQEQAGRLEAVMVHNVVLTMRTMIAAYVGKVQPALEMAERALERLPEDAIFLRGVIHMSRGQAYILMRSYQQANAAFDGAVQFGEAVGQHVLMGCLSNQGYVLYLQGRLREAEQAYQRVLRLASYSGGQSIPVLCMTYLGLGDIRREWDDLDEAQKYIQRGLEVGKRWGFAGMLTLLTITLGRVRIIQGDTDAALAQLAEAEELARQQQLDYFLGVIAMYRAQFHLVQGNLDAASKWAQDAGLYQSLPTNFLHELEYLTLATIHLATGAINEALTLLRRLLEIAEAGETTASLINILLVLALAYHAHKDEGQALTTLARALVLAEPGGYLRIFLDRGRAMMHLLTEVRARMQKHPAFFAQPVPLSYLDMLLSQSRKADRPTSATTSIESTIVSPGQATLSIVSERELEVLHLIAEGYSNREIAEKLVVAVSTVKSHVNALYSKLHVESRTQALAQARKLNLLP